AAFKEATRLKPNFAPAYFNLGRAQNLHGAFDEAIAAYKEVTRLQPDNAEAYCNLGKNLELKGRFTEALVAMRRGHELGSRNPNWPYPSARWVQECERLAAMEGKLLAFRKGEYQPKDSDETIGLAQVCQYKHLPLAAARLFGDAFAANPKLADDLSNG